MACQRALATDISPTTAGVRYCYPHAAHMLLKVLVRQRLIRTLRAMCVHWTLSVKTLSVEQCPMIHGFIEFAFRLVTSRNLEVTIYIEVTQVSSSKRSVKRFELRWFQLRWFELRTTSSGLKASQRAFSELSASLIVFIIYPPIIR